MTHMKSFSKTTFSSKQTSVHLKSASASTSFAFSSQDESILTSLMPPLVNAGTTTEAEGADEDEDENGDKEEDEE